MRRRGKYTTSESKGGVQSRREACIRRKMCTKTGEERHQEKEKRKKIKPLDAPGCLAEGPVEGPDYLAHHLPCG